MDSASRDLEGLSDADRLRQRQAEVALQAELEELWQEESPATAAVTEIADEVDGELGTRDKP